MKERAFSQHNEDGLKKFEQKNAENLELKQRCAHMERQLENHKNEFEKALEENRILKQAIPVYNSKLCAAESEVKRLQDVDRQKDHAIQHLQIVLAMSAKMQASSGDCHSSSHFNSFPPPPPHVY